MGFNLVVAFALLCAVGVVAANKIDCINQHFSRSLGEPYTKCHKKSGSIAIPAIKQCCVDVMISEGVVKRPTSAVKSFCQRRAHLKKGPWTKEWEAVERANNGQMTVNRNKFGEYGRNNNHPVGLAVKECARRAEENDKEMYKEAMRACQCIFGELKEKC